MTSKLIWRSALVVCALAVFTAPLSAQRVEFYPNAGVILPQHNINGGGFSADGIYGLKGGVFLGQNTQLEGSFGYLNHFQLRNSPNPFNPTFGITQPTVRGFLYDANVVYNFGERQFLSTRISPFVVAGAGGLTTSMPNASSTFIEGGGNVITPSGAIVPNPARSKVMNSGDTFFTINYGGGVKFLNVAGPLGFRVDVRGRTLPNFFGQGTTWLEPTGGITLSWGER